jgi:hypothetical protein
MDTFESILPNDPNFQDLIHALALSERFSFQLLVCKPPRLIERVLQVTQEQVSIIRGTTSPIILIDPYNGLASTQRPIHFSALVDKVLEPLLSLPKKLSNESLVFLNASRASQEEESGWIALFHKMNETRNQIIRATPLPLTLCLPPGFDTLFAREASDFWSIRSISVTIGLRHAYPMISGFSDAFWSETPNTSKRIGSFKTTN